MSSAVLTTTTITIHINSNGANNEKITHPVSLVSGNGIST